MQTAAGETLIFIMRNYANLLQALLIINGALSLLAGLFFGSSQGGILEALNAFVAAIVVILSVLFIPCLGLNRNLPKRVFLPQIFLLFWAASGLWPLSSISGQFSVQMFAAAMQVLLGILALFYIRSLNHKSLFLTPEMLPSPGFSLGYSLRFGIVGLLLLPVCLFFFGFSLSHSYVDSLSGGFVRLGLDGLYMKERLYRLDDKTIRLASMIHIGNQEYYDDLAQSISSGRTLVLAEGVSDEDGLLRETFSYGGIADFLGLSAQEQMELGGRLIDVEQLSEADFQGSENGLPDIARADIDLREFDPQTLEFINALGTYLLNSNSSLTEGFAAFNLWAQDHVTPETNDIIMSDLVTKRNRAVLNHLSAALSKYDTIVIPWGAMHMVGIEAAVKEQGFLLQNDHERRSIDFSKLPFAALLEKVSATEEEGL